MTSNRGAAYANKGQIDKAIVDYDKAIELKPKLTLAYDNRGLAFFQKGQYDRAIADYRKALEIDPSNSSARDKLKALGAKPQRK